MVHEGILMKPLGTMAVLRECPKFGNMITLSLLNSERSSVISAVDEFFVICGSPNVIIGLPESSDAAAQSPELYLLRSQAPRASSVQGRKS